MANLTIKDIKCECGSNNLRNISTILGQNTITTHVECKDCENNYKIVTTIENDTIQ